MGYVMVSGVLDEIENVAVDAVNAENSAVNNVLPTSLQTPMISNDPSTSSPSSTLVPTSTPDATMPSVPSSLKWVGLGALFLGGIYLFTRKKKRSNPGRRRRHRRGRR